MTLLKEGYQPQLGNLLLETAVATKPPTNGSYAENDRLLLIPYPGTPTSPQGAEELLTMLQRDHAGICRGCVLGYEKRLQQARVTLECWKVARQLMAQLPPKDPGLSVLQNLLGWHHMTPPFPTNTETLGVVPLGGLNLFYYQESAGNEGLFHYCKTCRPSISAIERHGDAIMCGVKVVGGRKITVDDQRDVTDLPVTIVYTPSLLSLLRS